MANRYPLILNAAAGQLQELPTGDSLDLGGESILGVGNLTVGGDFTVSGTTTNINTVNLLVEDKNIVIGDVASPTNTTADGGGVTLKGSTDKTIAWLNATAAWTVSEHISIASAKEYRIAGTKVLDATSLGSAVVGSSLTSVGTIATGVWNGSVIGKAYLDATVVSTGDTGTVTSTMILNGTILDADINASAGIVDTKLATIATAGKVSNSATTATSALGANTIVARDGNNNFVAGTITAALTGAASSNVLKAGDTMTGALVVPLGAFGTPSLTFTGDLNTGIYSPGADQVAVATNGTKRLTVDTAATTSTLPVVHPLGAVGTPSITFTGDLNTGFYSPAADTLAAVTAGSNRLHITSAGLVGIGNSSPSSYNASSDDLVVGDHVGAHGVTICSQNNSSGYIMFADGTTGAQAYAGQITYDHTNNRLTLGTNDGTTGLTVDSSQRVGIGTTSPGAILHTVNTSAGAATVGAFIQNSSITAGTEVRLGFAPNTNVVGDNRYSWIGAVNGTGSNDSALTFATAPGGAPGVERMRITSTGLVGIGTSAPADKLHISLGAATGNYVSYGGTQRDNNGLNKIAIFRHGYWSGIREVASIGVETTSSPVGAGYGFGSLVFYTGSSGSGDGGSTSTERMRIDAGGNVGIGTTGPGGTLDIKAAASTHPLIVQGPSSEFARIDSSGRLLVGTSTASGPAILQVQTPTVLSTTADAGVRLVNTSTKTYSTTASYGITAGLSQSVELGTAQIVDTVTPGGFNFVYGLSNSLTKSAGNTQDIERLNFTGFNQTFSWTDANTCKQYLGITDNFSYQGINANGRTSSYFGARNLFLSVPNGGTQTIANTQGTSNTSLLTDAATGTINITSGVGITPGLNFYASTSGTLTANITNYTFLGTSPFWGTSVGGTATNNITITNLYGLRLTAPSSSAGLTVTNNWGIRQEWSSAKNWFAGASNQFPNITTTASGANAFLDSADSNRLYRSTSSLTYKRDVEDLDSNLADQILNLRPVWYRSKCVADCEDWSWYGLIAEEVAEIDPRFVHYGYQEDAYEFVETTETVDLQPDDPRREGGIETEEVTRQTRQLKADAQQVPNGVAYERLVVPLLDIIKRQKSQLDSFESRLAALESQ